MSKPVADKRFLMLKFHYSINNIIRNISFESIKYTRKICKRIKISETFRMNITPVIVQGASNTESI